MNYNLISLNIFINYYWFFAPVFLFFSGEATMIIFGVLAVRYVSINFKILFIMCVISAFISEQILFLIPRIRKDSLKKYEHHWFYKKVVQLDYVWGLLIFFASRFFPVLRIFAPVALGTTNISIALFSLVNLVIAAIWCGVFSFLGVYIGKKTLHWQLTDILNFINKEYSYYKNIFFFILLGSIIVLLITYFIKKNIGKK
jgi:membrane protein DedA with SNARE-associated domain